MPKTNNNPVNVDAELADILSAEVVSQHTAPVFEPEDYNPVELEPEEETVMDYVNANPGGDPNGFEQINDEPQSLSPDDMATIGVNILDGLQRFGFAFLKKKTVFTDQEQEILGNIDESGRTIYKPGSPEDIANQKYQKYLQFIKTLPFRDDEKQRLTDATKIYFRTTKVKVSPLTGLLLAYSEVLGMRAINTFSE